jgi:hypothetical protein
MLPTTIRRFGQRYVAADVDRDFLVEVTFDDNFYQKKRVTMNVGRVSLWGDMGDDRLVEKAKGAISMMGLHNFGLCRGGDVAVRILELPARTVYKTITVKVNSAGHIVT